jgi:hypothetical protein
MLRIVSAIVLVFVAASLCFATEAVPKTYGKKIEIKETTSVNSINSEPNKYVDKEVLVTGKVSRVCKGMGCWIEVESDSSKIICRSLDESILVPKDCEGRAVRVMGKVKFDKKASGKDAMKKEGDGPVHACPAPKVFVSTSGIELADMVSAISVSTAPTAPAQVTPAPAAVEKVEPVPAEKPSPTSAAKPAPAPEEKPAPTSAEKPAPTQPTQPK